MSAAWCQYLSPLPSLRHWNIKVCPNKWWFHRHSLSLHNERFTCSAELNYNNYNTHQVTCWAGLWSRASSDGSSRELDYCCCWTLLIWTQTLSTQTTLDHHWPVIITISTVCQLNTLIVNHTQCPLSRQQQFPWLFQWGQQHCFWCTNQAPK